MNEIECETCIKRKTMYCPNSSECFNTENKPHYQNRIKLLEKSQKLEHNWNELKKWVQSQYLRTDDESDYETAFLMIEDKMQELEEGGNNDNRT